MNESKFKKSTEIARLTVNLPADLIKKIKLEAVHRDITAGELMKGAIEEYFKKAGRQCK